METRKLSLDEMSLLDAGKMDAATMCGFGVAIAIFAPGPWSLLGLALCLVSDTR
jgi:hypothetical protein